MNPTAFRERVEAILSRRSHLTEDEKEEVRSRADRIAYLGEGYNRHAADMLEELRIRHRLDMP
jgi:hypothetical protein